ncbi:MAG TPA: dTMP kinase [Thermoanaerobaculia bacterium]|nr:dTMP kinase [Thermoanaerobaculia bacterium]
MRGVFITFEGLDGSGKSTHLKRAVEWLEAQGKSVVVTREPGGTALGAELRRLFLEPGWRVADGTVELLLVFASRRQHLLEVIDPALALGQWVLCDRFTDSTVAYQGFGRGVPLPDIRLVERLATGSRRPDRTLLFDLPAELARERGHSPKRRDSPEGIDRLDAEELEFYQRVRQGYLSLLEQEPERITRIDSSGDRELTAEQVRLTLAQLL